MADLTWCDLEDRNGGAPSCLFVVGMVLDGSWPVVAWQLTMAPSQPLFFFFPHDLNLQSTLLRGLGWFMFLSVPRGDRPPEQTFKGCDM